jgi:hydrogenase maturation protease
MVQKPKILVLGLGNTLVSDDGVGIYIVQNLKNHVQDSRLDFQESSAGGLRLLDILPNYDIAVIIDSIKTGKNPPGHFYQFTLDDFKSPEHHPSIGHTISLPTVLKLGEQLGYDMPHKVIIYAIEINDNETLHEGCTPRVAATLEQHTRHILHDLQQLLQQAKQ